MSVPRLENDIGAPPVSFAEWLVENPVPDLQELVARFGSYSAITAAGWQAFDAAIADWQQRYRSRAVGSALRR